MTVITTSPPKPPEPEITSGPWDIADWRVQDYGPRPDEDGWTFRVGVAADVRHRETGECRRNGAAIKLTMHQDAEERLAGIARAKDILRAWVDDLNAAEREDQSA